MRLLYLDDDVPVHQINEMYENACNIPSDINEHVKTLHDKALECDSVIECGTRSCVSIWGLLSAMEEKGGKLYSIDLERSRNISLVEHLAKTSETDFKFYEMSDLDVDIEKADMVFIDTFHVYKQLQLELKKYSKIAQKYIIMHDTSVDEYVGEHVRSLNNRWTSTSVEDVAKEMGWSLSDVIVGLGPAVIEFLESNKEWELEERYTNCNGLTILRKK